jgi:hypothetical protein
MIEGLKLTMTGEELRTRLNERIDYHRDLVEHYKTEATREPDPKDEFDFVLPEHMCEYEQQLHEWRADTLEYIREHVEGGEVYRLGPADLAFGEILPQKPGLVEQDEFERENRVGFSMERIAKEMGRSHGEGFANAEAIARQRDAEPPTRRRRKKRTTTA